MPLQWQAFISINARQFLIRQIEEDLSFTTEQYPPRAHAARVAQYGVRAHGMCLLRWCVRGAGMALCCRRRVRDSGVRMRRVVQYVAVACCVMVRAAHVACARCVRVAQ